jgi:hypothetical protein
VSTIQVWPRDIEIALDALRFRRYMLNATREHMEEKGESITQKQIKIERDNHAAIANLEGRLAKARSRSA